MKRIMIPLGVMSVCSVVFLLLLSILTYIFKWKADTALIGITLIYILAGFTGGCCKKRISYEISIAKKLLEGVWIGSLFMVLLFVVSILGMGNGIVFGSRLFMIWMIVIGSTALGRIL